MARTIAGLRWWIIGLIMLGAILNYLARSTLAVAAPTLFEALNISEKEYSWITTAFQFAIMCQPVVGYVLDVVGLKLGLAAFVLVWGVVGMAHAFGTTWQHFAFLRAIMGFAEGSANPAGMKAASLWFPAKERGFAGGIYNIGASVGSMLAPPLVVWAILTYNWQSAFVLTGGLAVIWVVLWLVLYYDPSNHPRLSQKEREHILGGQEQHLKAEGKRPPVLSILQRRNFWGIALPRFLADPTWGTLAFWVPLYLYNARGFDLKGIAIFAWLPFLAADLGCLSGPTIAHFLQRRGVSILNARRIAFTIGALMMTGVMFVGYVGNVYLAIALICLAGFAHQTLSVTVITMASDLFKQNEVATVAGMAGAFGNLGLMIFSLMIGGLVATVGYTPFFVALAVFDLIGVVVLWSLVREPQKDQTVPAWFPLLVGALLTAALILAVKAYDAGAFVGYYVGEHNDKTYLFYPWVYYTAWSVALLSLAAGAALLLTRKQGQAA